MGSSISLGRIWGIPLGVNYSWFLVLGLAVFLLSTRFAIAFPQWLQAEHWGLALVTALFLFGSVVAHELAHSVVAVWRGIPVRGITLFVFGGVSQISREASRPRVELLIAVVGPLTSIALGGLFLGIWYMTRFWGTHLHAWSEVLWQANILLGLFNMMPGFPLDGGRVLHAATWGITGNYRIATWVATLAGQLFAIFLIAGGVFLTLQLRMVSSLWLVLIGAFLFSAASSTQRQARQNARLRGVHAQDIMRTDPVRVPQTLTLENLVRDYALHQGNESFLVTAENGKEDAALVRLRDLRRIPRSQWGWTTVGQVAIPLAQVPCVDPTAAAEQVQELLDDPETVLVLVISQGQVLGSITREGIARYLMVRRELGL